MSLTELDAARLYVQHRAAARRVAAQYRRGPDVDDLVDGAFERMLAALRRGRGPTRSPRAYLFVTLRRLAAETARRREEPLDDAPEPEAVAGLDRDEREIVLAALRSLPEQWRTVLWQTAVEGRPPREIAPALGISANAAAALAWRAREALRQAWLQAHLQAGRRPRCEPHRGRLGPYVRQALGSRDRAATAAHVAECRPCADAVDELAALNAQLDRRAS